MKKFTCLVLALCCITMPVWAFASSFDTNVNQSVAYNDIVRDVASAHNINASLCSIFDINNQGGNKLSANYAESLNCEKAIEFVNLLSDGSTEITIIIPFKELPDGTLVNSFEYASNGNNLMSTQSTGEREVILYDLDATLRATYKIYKYAIRDTYKAGQMYQGSFSWTKINSSSSAKVNRFEMTIVARGELYTVPDYVNESTLLDSNYDKFRVKNVSTPSASTWYYTSTLMSTSEGVVYCSDIEDGGWVTIDVEYTNANGSALRNYGTTVPCFSE